MQFEGHDTTAAGLTWAIYNFGKYPAALQRARAEIDHVLGTKTAPNYEDMSKFEYLERCIKEVRYVYFPFMVTDLMADAALVPTSTVLHASGANSDSVGSLSRGRKCK